MRVETPADRTRTFRFSSRPIFRFTSRPPRDVARRLTSPLRRSPRRTGRNLAHYPSGVRLTATDCSAPMVEVFREKAKAQAYGAEETAKGKKNAPPFGTRETRTRSSTPERRGARQETSSARTKETKEKKEKKEKKSRPTLEGLGDETKTVTGALPKTRRILVDARVADVSRSPFESNSFDFVVDTFGLCSFEDPVAALREMSRVCRSDAATDGSGRGVGKIYLLEHGRSDWEWVSNILDAHAEKHAKRWGCYWNRDIEKIVREAGLEILQMSRYHLGTTYYVVAAPAASMEKRKETKKLSIKESVVTYA